MKLSDEERAELRRAAESATLRDDMMQVAEARDRYLAQPEVTTPEACVQFLLDMNELLGHEQPPHRPFLDHDMKL